jgi:hypothetical protein
VIVIDGLALPMKMTVAIRQQKTTSDNTDQTSRGQAKRHGKTKQNKNQKTQTNTSTKPIPFDIIIVHTYLIGYQIE